MANQTIATTFKVVDEMSPAFQKMNKALQNLDGSVNGLENDLNGIDSTEITALKDSVKQTESAFSGLGKQASTVSGVTSEFKQLANTVGSVGSESGEIRSVSNALDDLGSSARQASNEMQSLSDFDGLSSLSDSMDSLNKSLDINNFLNFTEIASGIADSLSELGSAAMEASQDMSDATIKIQTNLGLTDEATSNMVDHAREVLRNGYGESLDAVSDSIIQVSQNLKGVDDSNIVSLTEKAITLEDVMGSDMNETLRGANALMEGFGVTSEEAFDLIVTGTQRGLNKTDELGDNLAEYSMRWGEAGVSAQEYFSLLETGMDNGAYQLDKVGDFLNEFLTSLSDGRMDEAMAGFSQSTQDVFNLYKSGGADAKDVLDSVIGEINNMSSATDQAAIASTLWSSLGEDNALGMITSLGGVENKYSDIAGAADAAVASNSSAMATLNGEIQDLRLSLAPIGDFLANIAVGGVQSLRAVFEWIASNSRAVIAGLTGITAAIGAFSAASAISNAGGLSAAIGKMGAAVANSGLASSLLALINPATLAIGAIVGLGAATAALMANGASLTDVADGFNNFDEQIQQFVTDFGSLIPTLVQGIKSKLPELASQAGAIMGALVSGIVNSGVNLIGAGVQVIIQLATGLAQAMPTIVSSGLTFLTNLLNGVMAGIPQVAGTILEVIANIVGTIAENLPALIQAGMDTLQAFASGIGQNLPTIIAQAFVTISGFIQTIAEHLPELITKGFELISNLIAGIIQSLPTLLTTAVTLIGQFAMSIIQNLPQILQAGVNLVGALVTGLIQSIPALLAGTAQLLGTIMQSLADLIPQAWNKMVEVGTNIVEGLKQGFTNAWNAMGDFFTEKFNGLVGGVKSLLGINSPSTEFAGMGENMVAGLQQGFGEKMPVAIETINAAMAELQAITQERTNVLVTSVTDQYTNLATTLQTQVTNMTNSLNAQWQLLANTCISILTRFNQTMVSTMASLVAQVTSSWNLMYNNVTGVVNRLSNALNNLIRNLVNSLKSMVSELPGHFKSVADQMMNSLVSGINSKQGEVTSAASQLVQKLKTTFETGLGIHSPSDYMIWVGQMMLAGLMEGMSPNDVQSFITSVVGDMQKSFSDGKFNATETVDFLTEQGTLDLIAKVTGMDLSEVMNNPASIPGIVQAAQQEVGYKSPGGRTNSKYGLQYGNASDWCVSFVRAMAEKAGVNFPATNYVPDVMAWAKSNGRWTMTPQSGYAAIYGGGSHIELVKSVDGAGNVTTIGGNTGSPRGVYEHVRNGATGYVALDGGHGVGSTLANALQTAYNAKYHPELLTAMGGAIPGGVGIVPNVGEIGYPLAGIAPITSLYGYRIHPVFGVGRGHAGIDLGAGFGTPILSAMAGVVKSAGVNGGYGNAVVVSTGGLDILYGHMSQIMASQGQNVSRGQTIGLVGSTGWSTGPHLHFEMRTGGGTIDPLDYLIAAGQPGYYTGTDNARKGWALVGEKGPELVNFGGGEVVKNNSETNAILSDLANTGGYNYDGMISTATQNEVAMSNSAAPVNINVNNEIHNEGDLVGAESRITQTIAQTIRRERKVTGGIPHNAY